MNTVIVFRKNLLPWSETFVRQQVLALQRWSPILIGEERVEKGLDLQNVDNKIIDLSARRPVNRLLAKLNSTFPSIKPQSDKEIEALAPRLIHAHFGVDAVAAWPTIRRLGLPMVVTLHGYDVNIRPDFWEQGGMGREHKTYPSVFREMSRDPLVSFIAVSTAIKKQAVDHYDISPEKMTVNYLGIDPSKFSASVIPIEERPLLVTYVGRMVEKKGPDILIKAVAEARKYVPEIKLQLIGDGPLKSDMESLALRIGCPASFLGVQGSEVVASSLKRSRLFCLPSITASNGDAEGLPIVLLEAQACGVPVITSAVGGRDEGIAPNQTGWAFSEGDIEQLTRLLVEKITNVEILNNVAHAGPQYINEHHNCFFHARELENIYDQVASK